MPYEVINEGLIRKTEWYALYTRHQHERIVAGSLSSRGFEIFLPLYEEIRNWSDRRKRISLPLFPCYVFVRTSLDRKLDILVTAGVHGIVSFDNHPAPVPQSEMDDLRRIARLVRIEPRPFLRYGDWVRVNSGPLEGVEGFLVRRKGLSRLVLSVEMLQKSVAVEIDAALTKKILRSGASRRAGFAAGCAERIGAAF
jgi:transcription antitermination factor NusG